MRRNRSKQRKSTFSHHTRFSPRVQSTLYQISHVERLARGLQEILNNQFHRPLPLRICCATVVAGSALSRQVTADGAVYLGRPWSTSGALRYLAGCGYVFNPLEALAALNHLEARYIIDRRRIDDFASSRSEMPGRGRLSSSTQRRNLQRRDTLATTRPVQLGLGNERYALS